MNERRKKMRKANDKCWPYTIQIHREGEKNPRQQYQIWADGIIFRYIKRK